MSSRTIEKTVSSMWKGAEYVPDIIVALEIQGIRASEKRVLSTAQELGLKGSAIESKILKNPSLIDKWWKDFERREQESEITLLEQVNAGKSIAKEQGVGRARHTVGCTVADELNEQNKKPEQIIKHLKNAGFEEQEIQKVRRDVEF